MEIILYVLALICHSYGQPVVNTEYGPVRGRLLSDVFNGEFYADVNAFHGIPYAKSTDGPRRFAVSQMFVCCI